MLSLALCLLISQSREVVAVTDSQISADLPLHLMGNQRPSTYNLFFKFDNPDTFHGVTTIVFLNVFNTNTVTLHGSGLKLDEVKLLRTGDKYKYGELQVSRNKIVQDSFTLTSAEVLLRETNYTLTIKYTGQLKCGRVDVLCDKDQTQRKGRVLLEFVTHFEPMGARVFYPCFDEPGLKAKFTVTVVHPRNLTAYSNMDQDTNASSPAADSLGAGLIKTTFRQTPPMSTYLLTVAVGDFMSKCNTTSKGYLVCVRVFQSIDPRPAHLKIALKRYSHYLDVFSDKFGYPYPLRKMDIIGPHQFRPWAMENWGIIVHAYHHPTSYGVVFINEPVIMHELLHQWFGNLVTCKTWCDIWLNEGLTTYFQMTLSRSRRMFTNAASAYRSLMSELRFRKEVTVICPISDQKDMDVMKEFIYTDFTQAGMTTKASLVIQMISSVVGEEAFMKGVKRYLAINAYGAANSGHFLDAVQNFTRINVRERFMPWLANGAFPEVHVMSDKGKWYLVQVSANEARARSGLSLPYARGLNESLWHIPIQYVTESDNETKSDIIWITDRITEFPQLSEIKKTGGWYMFNIGMKIPYFANYDYDNWLELYKTFITYRREHRTNNKPDYSAEVANGLRYFYGSGAVFGDLSDVKSERTMINIARFVHAPIYLQRFLENTVNATIEEAEGYISV